MSHLEYADWLMSVGVGWLGLSPKEVNESLMCDLLVGYDGKLEMLRSCYGGAAEDDSAIDDVDKFDARFGDEDEDDESS